MSTDLSELAARVPRPDDDARAAARARLADLAPAGAFGRLGELAEWIAGVQGQCPIRPLEQVQFVAVAPPAAASPALSPILKFSSATPRLVEGERPDSPDTVEQAFEAGLAVADGQVDSGADLIVVADVGGGSAIAAATVVAVLTGTDVASTVGSTGIDDREWMRRCAAVRDAARAARRALADGTDVIGLLSSVGNVELATCTGLLTQAAIRKTPVVLDGPGTAAAALVANRLSARTARWLLAGHVSPDPGHAIALGKLRLRPLFDYAISVDDGTGALLAVSHLQAAAQLVAADDQG